ncbi:MAG: DNA repair exonuclease [Anaerolineaceae bacterium]
MTGFRFVHAADLHLDSPFKGIQGAAPPNVHRRLLDATFDAYDAIIELCLSERVDALLVAGDVYDGADRSLKAQLRFIDGLKRLDAAGIRSFVCHGNHDPLDGWQANLRFPDSCHQFGAEVQAVELDPARPGLATVYGVSYPRRDIRHSLVPGFGRVSGDTFSIGLLHANVGANPQHGSYSPCSVEDLRSTGIDYWALGHVHTRQVLNQRAPVVVYPGNPQGRHPVETGERGVYLVEVGADREPRLSFRDVSAVRWVQVAVSIDQMSADQELIDAINLAVARVFEAGGRDVVSRLAIRGRGPLYTATRKADFSATLQARINDDWASGSPFGWCERVEIATKPAFDREEQRQAGDFVGDLLRLVDEIQADPAQLALLREELAPLYGHVRAKKYLGDELPNAEELRALLADAESACLEALS